MQKFGVGDVIQFKNFPKEKVVCVTPNYVYTEHLVSEEGMVSSYAHAHEDAVEAVILTTGSVGDIFELQQAKIKSLESQIARALVDLTYERDRADRLKGELSDMESELSSAKSDLEYAEGELEEHQSERADELSEYQRRSDLLARLRDLYGDVKLSPHPKTREWAERDMDLLLQDEMSRRDLGY